MDKFESCDLPKLMVEGVSARSGTSSGRPVSTELVELAIEADIISVEDKIVFAHNL